MPERENWSSRAAFIVAAIGSAIGFGNVWRFPSLAYEYGDGAFFIPYLLALFLIGIPVLILETAIGQYYQTGDAGAFGNINHRARGLGLASVLCSFVLNSYYSALMAWVVRMFIYSCQGSDGRWRNLESASGAYEWFQNEVTGLKSAAPGLVPTRIVWENLLALLFVWLVIFLCLAFGIKWTGRVAYITVGLPVLILFILVIRAVTLEGARDGIQRYIGGWDVSILSARGEVWSVAVTQIFFSIGVTLGIMTAYGSYNKRDSPVFSNAIIISLSNSFFSFIAGFAVFGIVGYIANIENKDVEDLNISGPGLMFGTFPVALSTLPGYGHWERLLFVALFMLGIDSAFSFVEAVTTVVQDSVMFHKVKRAYITAIICIFGFLAGILYTTDTGFIFLDVTDFYINFMLLLIGFAECLVVGWAYGLEEQIKKLGRPPVYGLALTSFGSVVTASGVWFGVAKNQGAQPSGWSISDWSLMWGFITLFICAATGLGLTVYFSMLAMNNGPEDAQNMTTREFFIELFMGNMLHLRKQLTGVVRYIPFIWFILIKHFIPQVLLILFVNLAASDEVVNKVVIGPRFGNYGGYNPGYQALGIIVFSLAMLVLGAGIIVPDIYKCFSVKTYEDENMDEGPNSKPYGDTVDVVYQEPQERNV